ncbi:MAG: RMD1 family protein [Cyclobacteriaceae bacterium]|jgi:uncharacterized Rmd1/YagE family protein|nr:RMD1 family protein [Cyclobacteriaceae bacterium]
MSKTIRLTAFLASNQLDIKQVKAFLELKPAHDSSTELFYKLNEEKFQYYFNFGVVVFTGFTEEEMKVALKTIYQFQKTPLATPLRDEFMVAYEPASETKFEFDRLLTSKLDEKVLRIAMFNLAQSVAIDHHHIVSESLLADVKRFANELEQTGNLSISRKNMMRFLGRALNTQNDIAENIYIFDAPDLVWDDEFLDKLHVGLNKHFDLRIRFSELEYTLRIIEDNLTVFREIYNQRESSRLEWIIIILILFEVFDLIISKILHWF